MFTYKSSLTWFPLHDFKKWQINTALLLQGKLKWDKKQKFTVHENDCDIVLAKSNGHFRMWLDKHRFFHNTTQWELYRILLLWSSRRHFMFCYVDKAQAVSAHYPMCHVVVIIWAWGLHFLFFFFFVANDTFAEWCKGFQNWG